MGNKEERNDAVFLKIKDPGSFITHYAAMLLSMLAAIPLFYRVALAPDRGKLIALGIFALSLVLLYGASAAYHFFDLGKKINQKLKKLDHMMIYFLIAGSYTPICVIALGNRTGFLLLLAVWLLASLGMLVNLIFIYTPRWLNAVIYIALGWTCAFAFPSILRALSPVEFRLLLTGGIIYTIGGIIYALKLPIFRRLPKYFGSHEIFHCFVMLGSMCHYGVMLLLA